MELLIQDLIGRDFYHKDAEHLIYTIAGREDERVRIVWNETEDVYYNQSEVCLYVEEGTWILL
jgi:hypothetical protein